MVVRARIVTGDLGELSFVSWLLALKSVEGNKATFSRWLRLDTLFTTQVWILLWHLLEAKASKKAVLRVRCLRSVPFIGCFCELIENNRKVPLRKIPGTIPVKTGE